MKVLLTGASSFTGYWFARELAQAGHAVTAVFRGRADGYAEIRARRVAALAGKVTAVWQTEFGSDSFIDLASSQAWDLVCHHASETADYRSPQFDALAAARSNTRNLAAVLAALRGAGCRRMVYTGSVFEPFEGTGDSEQRAFSPYGLSKHISFELIRLEARRAGIALGKFVIPNPFGPFEETRFTSYLAREWSQGKVPGVATPNYMRDNIHVGLLARAYRGFCESTWGNAPGPRCAPSGYVESQGDFTLRFARELGARAGRRFEVELKTQTDFAEPMIRVNTEPAATLVPDWSEDAAWSELWDYYRDTFFAR